MAKLVAIGESAGPEYVIGELCIIGRSPNAHVQLTNRAISRHHAKITRQEDGFIIEDLDSSHGTVVNGLAVTVSRLRTGDEIRIADTSFRFLQMPHSGFATADFSLSLYESTPVMEPAGDAATAVPLEPPPSGSSTSSVTSGNEALVLLRQRFQSVLATARLTINGDDPDAVLKQVMGHCLDIFPAADRALVAVPDRLRKALVIRALATRDGVSDGNVHFSRRLLAEVLSAGRSLILGGPFGASMPMPEPGQGGSTQVDLPVMVAPLIVRGQKLGLIYVDCLCEGTIFTNEDLELLDGLAALVALVLNTAKLNATLLRQSRTAQELAAAREVQKRFLPRGVPKMPGFSFVAHYEPCHNVGGDLYDFIQLDASRVGIVIGDVSGKGFGAALVMAWVASQLREAAHQEQGPVEVLERVNSSLLETRQEELFVTLLYGVLDRWTMNLTFCNAGHMPPLVYHGADRSVTSAEAEAGLPVGLLPRVAYEQERIQLGNGDAVLFYSDGVTEARNPASEMFGVERLRRAMAAHATSTPDMVSDVLHSLRAFVGTQEQTDDITMVALGVGIEMEDIRTTLPPGTQVGEF